MVKLLLTVLVLGLGTAGLAACGGNDDDAAGGATGGEAVAEGGSETAFCEQARVSERAGMPIFELDQLSGLEEEETNSHMSDLEGAAPDDLRAELTTLREWTSETYSLTTDEFQERATEEGYEEAASRVNEASTNVKGYLIDECGFEDPDPTPFYLE